MATGDQTLLQTLGYEIIAVCNNGTLIFEACSDGWLRTYAIAGGAVVDLAKFDEGIVDIDTDNTNIYVLLETGKVKKCAISGGAVTEIGTSTGRLLANRPKAITYYNGILYIAEEGGFMVSITTAGITSLSPSISPSKSPSLSPSKSPSLSPSISPSKSPSLSPSISPSPST
jgi:hypothetical protein